MKISKSFIIDTDIMKAYEVSRDFYLNLDYSEKSSIKPTLLAFKKRLAVDDGSSTESKDYVVRVDISFNPVGNLQLYSSSLITVKCKYVVSTAGRESNFDVKKFFGNEINQLKSKLVGKLFSKQMESPKSKLTVSSKNETSVEETETELKANASEVPNRVSTGFNDLDKLLLGGLPEKYAVILSSPSNDEREILIKNFLKTGVEANEITFYLTLDSKNGRLLAEEYPQFFFLFLSNPRADDKITDLPNVVKVNGVGTLSQIDIALTKSLRALEPTPKRTRRICIDILSDVLLQHQAVITRKWISGLLSDLKSNGFTIIAVINPLMHPPDQVQAILGLFDGEIKLYEKETATGIENFLRIRKMYNQEYLKTELKVSIK